MMVRTRMRQMQVSHSWPREGQATEAVVDGETNVGTACCVSTSVMGVKLLAGRTSV